MFIEDLKFIIVVYYFGGCGGGFGMLNNGFSSVVFGCFFNLYFFYGSNIDWDCMIVSNCGVVVVNGMIVKMLGCFFGILCNSVNNQDQYGVVFKFSY